MNRRMPKAIEVVSEPVAAILRRKTPAERVRIASDMHHSARVMVRNVITHQHPDWTEVQIQAEMRRRFLGETN